MVDVGYKSEGIIELQEWYDEGLDKVVAPKAGDQRRADKRHGHHLQVGHAICGKHREIVHHTLPPTSPRHWSRRGDGRFMGFHRKSRILRIVPKALHETLKTRDSNRLTCMAR